MTKFTGTREAFAAAISDIAKTDERLLFVSGDSLKAMRATSFADEYPERYIEVGIAEQAAVNVAAGLATCNFIPFVGTYAGFLTMRACEQMRTFVAYPNLNVKFVAINAGLIGGEREGVTHQFYEDLGILSSIPNITIFTPADAAQTYEARTDYFGGLGGKQDIVMAKIQGDDKRFNDCRLVSELMYAPVLTSYVLSVRDIAFLEPTLVELLGATCLYAMAETVKEGEKRGIPKEAAVSFLAGHIFNLSANFLGFMGDTPVSDACKVAIGLGDKLVLREDWKKIWDDEILDKVIATMLHPDKPQI